MGEARDIERDKEGRGMQRREAETQSKDQINRFTEVGR